jgi:hypothetical protein
MYHILSPYKVSQTKSIKKTFIHVNPQIENKSIFFNFKSPIFYIWCIYVTIFYIHVFFIQVENFNPMNFFGISINLWHVNAWHFMKNCSVTQKNDPPYLLTSPQMFSFSSPSHWTNYNCCHVRSWLPFFQAPFKGCFSELLIATYFAITLFS